MRSVEQDTTLPYVILSALNSSDCPRRGYDRGRPAGSLGQGQAQQ
jgi:hypothetical protein